MDSALRPREIQFRIRAGQSLEEVAQSAGVPAERIEAYAAPVLAEREYVAGLALAATVRRRGESGSHRNLRPVVTERLTSHGIDPDSVDWEAWRNEDRRWSVRATWTDHGETHSALFAFDLPGRFSVATDDEARWLISESTQEQEEADEEDELALVRAVSAASEAPAEADAEPTVSLPDESSGPATLPRLEFAAERTEFTEIHVERTAHPPVDLPRSAATPQEIGEEVEAEIDSYGLIPEDRSELDVLYDMLGGIAEDSINIYAGLSDPVVPPSIDLPAPAATNTEPGAGQVSAPTPQPTTAMEGSAATSPTRADVPERFGSDRGVTELAAGQRARSADAPGQPELTDDPEATIPIRPGASKRRRKGRAQVPSWEEIMFGGPKTD